jgi:hypothetical protein
MKKKHRDITVGDKIYGWIADYTTLRIWYDKKLIHIEYLDGMVVTPQSVRDIIQMKNL